MTKRIIWGKTWGIKKSKAVNYPLSLAIEGLGGEAVKCCTNRKVSLFGDFMMGGILHGGKFCFATPWTVLFALMENETLLK